MSTVIRSEISQSNPYYISKHRFYELKHHCLQYNEWRTQMASTTHISHSKPFCSKRRTSVQIKDETGSMAILRASTSKCMREIEEIAEEAGGDIAKWIFISVTEGKAYSVLQAYGIPCGKEYFYNRYRKFFYMLSQSRE